jgi:hypothetical protein
MLRQQWQALCKEAVEKPGSTWTVFSAECPADSTTFFADFSKKGEKLRRINVLIAHQTDDDIKAEIVRKLAASDE